MVLGDRFEEQREQQRRRATLHTSGHAWRTAAVMTCFLTPFGFVIGLVAVIVMRGLGPSIDNGREAEAEQKLKLGRILVLGGATIATIALAISVVEVSQFLLSMPEQLEQLKQRGGP